MARYISPDSASIASPLRTMTLNNSVEASGLSQRHSSLSFPIQVLAYHAIERSVTLTLLTGAIRGTKHSRKYLST